MSCRSTSSLLRLGSRRFTRPSHSRLLSTTPSRQNDPVADALRNGAAVNSSLLAPVHVPKDPIGVLHPSHPATGILEHSSIVVHRQLEMMNVMLGFEEANKYVILDPTGSHIGYMAERELGMANAISRQMLRTHRQFTTHIFDRSGSEVLRLHRPFSFINSTICVYDPVDPNRSEEHIETPSSTAVTDHPLGLRPSLVPPEQMSLIGQAQQVWAPLRRKYDLYLARQAGGPDQGTAEDIKLEDFAYIDSPFLSWDFSLRSTTSPIRLGSVDRNFMGFGRELFTDTGVYALRMDSALMHEEEHARNVQLGKEAQNVELLPSEGAAMTLDQRAVMLAMAVTIDYDYFSRDRGGFMFMPIPFGGGGGAGAGGAAAGEAGAGAAAGAGAGAAAGGVTEAGALEGAGAAAGGLARGAAGGVAAEGAMGGAVGAGSIAGYEAMQRARGEEQRQNVDEAGGRAPAENAFGSQNTGPQEDVWGYNSDPAEQQQPDRDPGSQNGQRDQNESDDDDWFGDGGGGGGGSGKSSGGGGDDGGGDGGDWLSDLVGGISE